ncbi:MAG: ribosome recycling factor [Thermodesulfobacteriota bacterium]
MPEDEVKRNLTKIQEITDSFIEKINQALERKEKEIKEI